MSDSGSGRFYIAAVFKLHIAAVWGCDLLVWRNHK